MREGAARAARHLCAPFPRISARAHVPSGFAALPGGLLALSDRPIPSGGIIKNRSEIKG